MVFLYRHWLMIDCKGELKKKKKKIDCSGCLTARLVGSGERDKGV